ncbi:formate dehydrogenase subunit gamma [Alsobacter soli]|uniref:Formate dehydrogenase subunit gamma n=1 Tax=Alsobacter soli TaxID=2109933 RepID=A0A2T1HRJ7_9HYPH|nr:formate dehydrogenase subunit gamma [Alsobacter soli]PSC04252.1 formate dehydrogenase subunit gamma [Alsobacter soli]
MRCVCRLLPALAVLAMLAVALVPAARAADPMTGANPTAQSVNERDLLNALGKLQGRITIPDGKAATLEQPQGREYRSFHERVLPWLAGIIILAVLAGLAAFYLIKGRIPAPPRDPGGRTVLRFSAVERLGHWLTATAFVVLAITGLNYFFGKRLLMPLIGADAFATWSHWAKYAHNFVAWAFMLGLLVMIVAWVRDNIPDRVDIAWLRAGGGFLDGSHPPAERFNAGQKLMFWGIVIFGLAISVSGVLMLFPFALLDINGMQFAQYVHATAAVLLIAVILGHIYIGTLGMEGAFQAMESGSVDLNWARTHHSVWAEKVLAEERAPRAGRPGTPAPAE